MVTKILIVDDEPLARQRLIRLLEDMPSHEVIAEAGNGDEALEQVSLTQPDIVFLDIRMPGMDGLEVARRLAQLPTPPAVIFCTAYDDYAISAFKVSAIDYLLKPVRKEALVEALSNAHKVNKVQLQKIKTHSSETDRPVFVAKTLRGSEIIAIDQILYFLADQKYVTIHHLQGETLTDTPLKHLENQYKDYLLRIHRNCLVNKNWIEGLERDRQGHHHVRLKGQNDRLDVSRRHTADVKAWIDTRSQ